jgi:hypothetical protein
MVRVSFALLLAVWLVPTPGAAQTASLPPIFSNGAQDLYRAGPNVYAPTYDRLPVFTRQIVTGGYPIVGASMADDPSPVTSRYMARGLSATTTRRYYEPARLRVDVVPSTARVYVDGSFIGTVSDVNYRSGGYALPAGSHRVSVRAPGYTGSAASVWIPPGQSVLYQDYLDQSFTPVRYRTASLVPVAYYWRPVWSFGHHFPTNVSGPPPTYVIPGCYMGDAPPQRPEKLPPGCKLENLKRVYH